MSKVVVVGSYAVGLVMEANRLPAPGETIRADSFQEIYGGKGSNQAVACSRMGAEASFIGVIGKDSYGEAAREMLDREGVSTDHLYISEEASTGAGFVMVDNEGENSIMINMGANELLAKEDIDNASKVIADADVLLTQLEIPTSVALYAGKVARQNGTLAILNPAPAPEVRLTEGQLSPFSILTPNYTEACAISGIDPDDEIDEEHLGVNILDQGVGALLLTLGAKGSAFFSREERFKVTAPSVDTKDTTGAGDAFNGALVVMLAEGEPVSSRRTISIANCAGALSVKKYGVIPALPYRDEVTNFFNCTYNS